MTKTVFWALLLVLAFMPVAQAHGAPTGRAIDSRVLTDNTQGGDYGEISLEVTNVPNPVAANEAVDLLALDVREAYGPDGSEGVWMRLVYQGGGEGTHRIELGFSVGGSQVSRFFESSDLITWAGDADFVLAEPIPVGDGYPQAMEFFLSSNSIGSGTLTDISIVSKLNGSDGDFAPGTYQTILGLPAELPFEDSETLDFVMDGPDELLRLEGFTDVDLANAGDLEITLTNVVGESQFVSFATQMGFGGTLGVTPNSVALGPMETVTLTLSPSAPISGTATLTATSDLGGRATGSFAYQTESVPLPDTDGVFGIDELLPPGASYEFTFLEAGSFGYHCHPHPFMTGNIVVQEGANPLGATTHDVVIFDNGLQSTPEEMGFLDAATGTTTTTIYEGDTVRWTNSGTHPDYHNINPGGHDGTPHDHGNHDLGDDKDTPSMAVPLLGVAVLALAFVRRRP